MSIQARNVSFFYGERAILKSISFSIEEGEFVSLLGENGAGKTTLLRCILGLEKSYTGDIFINNKNIKEMNAVTIAAHVASVPQTTSPAFNYNVENMVLMGASAGLGLFRTPGRNETLKAESAMEKLGITGLKNRSFSQLSGGERQLVIIARALAQNTGIIIFDEPTAALDLGHSTGVMKKIRSLSDEGITVIQTTHDPQQAYMFSDRIIALKNGELLADGKPETVITKEIMSRLYNTGIEVESLKNDTCRVCVVL